jgi:hypothetical protein
VWVCARNTYEDVAVWITSNDMSLTNKSKEVFEKNQTKDVL